MFPIERPRRLRYHAGVRDLIRETRWEPGQLIYPVFVKPGQGIHDPIISMPGIYQWSLDKLVDHLQEVYAFGVKSFLLFGIPSVKDAVGSEAYDSEGIIQRTLRALHTALPQAVLIADLCLCEYTDHGHCGVIRNHDVDNDETVELLTRAAKAQAEAGATIIAPSDMMDGRVQAIRQALDNSGHPNIPIMSYASKYASAFYGPFREAADNAPSFGDRRSYQMDPANRKEAMKEVLLDLDEGADMLIVKPAVPYLDIVSDIRKTVNVPVAAYHVSGEYAMIKAAAQAGWIDEMRVVDETLTSIRRAGADMIITYYAPQAAVWYQEKHR